MAKPSGPQIAVASERHPEIDFLRTVAIVRVVLWHTFAATWMTFIAAMPVLFFINGTLLAVSSERSSYRTMLERRVRRLLPPVWLYGAVVLLGGAAHASVSHDVAPAATVTVSDIVSWLIPVVDPRSSVLPHGWLTSHLWYVRAYLWILILTPLLVHLARRLRLALPVLCGGVVAIEVAGRLGVPMIGSGPAHVVIGDAVTYGTFAVLGMAYHFKRPALRRGAVLGGIAIFLGFVAAYVLRVGIPPGGVNDSYPLTLLTGLVWLLLAAAAEPWIRWVAVVGRLRRVISVVNRRAVTIYLWHPAAIVIAYGIVDRMAIADRIPPLGPVAVFAVVVALTAVASHAAGWVEDLAAQGKRPALRPRRGPRSRLASPALSVLALTAALVALPLTPEPRALASRARGSSGSLLPPPSYRPALTDASFARKAPNSRTQSLHLPGGASNNILKATLDEWLGKHPEVGSVAVAVDTDGETWASDAHHVRAPSATQARDVYGVASVTKTFTLALVLRAVDQGRIKLDAPVRLLPGVGAPPLGIVITPRQLLQHTSGLVDYPAARGYDPSVPLTPAGAVRLSLDSPLQSAPGERVNYANSNYQYLGLLLEHVNRRPYEAQVADLVRSVGLRQTRVDPSNAPGWIGFASGGVHSTVADLARWGTALFSPGWLLSPALASELTTVGPYNIGLGTWPLCPCSTDETQQKGYTAIGQYTGHGGLYHTPDGVTLAVHIEPPIEGADLTASSLIEAVLQTLRAEARPPRPGPHER